MGLTEKFSFSQKTKWRRELPKKKGLGQFADLMEGRLGKREGAGFLKGEGVYI